MESFQRFGKTKIGKGKRKGMMPSTSRLIMTNRPAILSKVLYHETAYNADYKATTAKVVVVILTMNTTYCIIKLHRKENAGGRYMCLGYRSEEFRKNSVSKVKADKITIDIDKKRHLEEEKFNKPRYPVF